MVPGIIRGRGASNAFLKTDASPLQISVRFKKQSPLSVHWVLRKNKAVLPKVVRVNPGCDCDRLRKVDRGYPDGITAAIEISRFTLFSIDNGRPLRSAEIFIGAGIDTRIAGATLIELPMTD
jgi:hypothetical protein